jgi:hypothetical protein
VVLAQGLCVSNPQSPSLEFVKRKARKLPGALAHTNPALGVARAWLHSHDFDSHA